MKPSYLKNLIFLMQYITGSPCRSGQLTVSLSTLPIKLGHYTTVLFCMAICMSSVTPTLCQTEDYAPWVWPSEPPEDCPFEPSKDLVGIALTKNYKHYKLTDGQPYGDTFYPSWASNDTLYSPWTDGRCPRLDGTYDVSSSADRTGEPGYLKIRGLGKQSRTGQAVMAGDDPLDLKIHSLGLTKGNPAPYGGRYPCGSLIHNGVWYYGTYCLGPKGSTTYDGFTYNWPWLGPLVGFRVSTDYGITWQETPHTPEKSIFKEDGMWGHPVKMGAPHFVDFGKNMEHSPDGKAYLIGMGAEENDPKPRFANLSWITGDQVYISRVTPSVENINDMSKYEFFAGNDANGNAKWSSDFEKIKPLFDWNNNTGCVTMTYNAALKKYITVVTDGWPTCTRMNSYILESDNITGPFKLVSYMKDFGQQAYFLNFPTKFISKDGKKTWLCYSGNFAPDWNGEKIYANPPGSDYGLVMQELLFLDKKSYSKYKNNPRPALE